MDQSFSTKKGEKPRILVAPLDWGLGHATRCIPLIRQLLALECDVWLAGEGAQEKLLAAEFPMLRFLPLPGYRISYAKTRKGLAWKIIKQVPKIVRAIRHENKWLRKMVSLHKLNAVISDNRYGLYHPGLPCIIITHQLQIKSSAGKWTEKIIQRQNYKYINRFTACWVPDREKENTIGGELSHPRSLPAIPVHYIGLLSRFEKNDSSPNPVKKKKNHLVMLLSGPEPQRSTLEELIIRDISHYNFTATIARGLPATATILPSTNMIKFYNHLPAEELQEAILAAEYVISRSGYSSIMDILALQKKSILVPTPGQTEQEYLGTYAMKKGLAVCVQQKDFSLTSAVAMASDFQYEMPETNAGGESKKIIANFVQGIKQGM